LAQGFFPYFVSFASIYKQKILFSQQKMKFAVVFGLALTTVFAVTCNPKTKVGVCSTKTAVGDCNWTFSAGAHGAHVNVQGVADNSVARICGPGDFVFSPMSCEPPTAVGSHFSYKTETFSCEENQNCACRTVHLKHFATCYAVNCTQ